MCRLVQGVSDHGIVFERLRQVYGPVVIFQRLGEVARQPVCLTVHTHSESLQIGVLLLICKQVDLFRLLQEGKRRFVVRQQDQIDRQVSDFQGIGLPFDLIKQDAVRTRESAGKGLLSQCAQRDQDRCK